MQGDLDGFVADEEEGAARRFHESSLGTLAFLQLKRNGFSTWYSLETVLDIAGFEEGTIADLLEEMESRGLVEVQYQPKTSGPNSVVVLTPEGKRVAERIQELERAEGYPIAKAVLLGAIERRLELRSPELSRKNITPVLLPLVESWISSADRSAKGV